MRYPVIHIYAGVISGADCRFIPPLTRAVCHVAMLLVATLLVATLTGCHVVHCHDRSIVHEEEYR